MDKADMERAERLRRMTNEMLKGLTSYEQYCMLRVHLAEADHKPVDPEAKRVIEEAVDRFNAAWRRKREAEQESNG